MKKIILLIGLFITTTTMISGRDSPSLYDRSRDRAENQYVYYNSVQGYYDGSGGQYDMTLPSDWSSYRTYDWHRESIITILNLLHNINLNKT